MTAKRLLGLAGVVALAVTMSGPALADDGADLPVTWQIDVSASELSELAEAGYDIARYADGSAIVVGTDDVADELRAAGYEPTFNDTIYKDTDPVSVSEDTYYGGYRTVEAHHAHLEQVAADNPDLATLHDIGDSWLKTQGDGGHDILAICLTNKNDGDCELSPDSEKPRFSLMGQMHAREIATGEIAQKWIDKLVEGYGTDDEVTELMDTTELWVVPIANPDGVDVVASGGDSPVLHRKNVNDSYGSCVGVDLNRNSSFGWGDDSTNPCAETYQGPSAASEPEVAAIEEWLRAIHPDQREDELDSPAPDDARDVFISLHSYGEYIIVPWGFVDEDSPNNEQLRALGAAMSEHNGYLVGTNSDTVGYDTSGTTDDMSYGELGVASFTFEMGGNYGSCSGFLPEFSCVDGELWSLNEGALMVAAQAAAAPYAG